MIPDIVSHFSLRPHTFVTLPAQILAGGAAMMAAIIQSRLHYPGGFQPVAGFIPAPASAELSELRQTGNQQPNFFALRA
jgi:hypothetical protein